MAKYDHIQVRMGSVTAHARESFVSRGKSRHRYAINAIASSRAAKSTNTLDVRCDLIAGGVGGVTVTEGPLGCEHQTAENAAIVTIGIPSAILSYSDHKFRRWLGDQLLASARKLSTYLAGLDVEVNAGHIEYAWQNVLDEYYSLPTPLPIDPLERAFGGAPVLKQASEIASESRTLAFYVYFDDPKRASVFASHLLDRGYTCEISQPRDQWLCIVKRSDTSISNLPSLERYLRDESTLYGGDYDGWDSD
jgi:hypothetical protein